MPTTTKNFVTERERAVIEEAVKKGMEAGRLQASSTAKDAFKATERRLYSLPVLERKIKSDMELIKQIQVHGSPQRSKSVVRFNRTGYRVDPEEMQDATLQDLEAQISADEHEVETLYRAMEAFEDDPFYDTVTGRYVDRYDDEDIAGDLGCSTSQVWKQRTRIVKDIAVMLYGAGAV